MNKFKLITHFLLSVILTFLCASVFHTQFVLAGIIDLGINIELHKRIYMSLQDIKGLSLSYGIIVSIGLGLSFSIVEILVKYISISKKILYPLAGALAMLAILELMQPILGVTLLAGARSTLGVLMQMFAGLLGGLLFCLLRAKSSKKHIP